MEEVMDEAAAGSGLAAERTRRLGLLDEMRATGTDPYPYRFDRTHDLRELRATWGGLEAGTETDDRVRVAGRVMLLRDSGKLIFATVRDRSGDVQLFVSKAVMGDDAFAAAKELDLGDWVGVTGTVMTTRKGELSVKTEQVELLAKAIRPMPDKWHGLTDTDTRFRQRYADLIVNDEARRAFEIRHAVIASFRRTLHERGFIEVETPVLHVEAGGAHARPFVTHHNTLDVDLYLRIALELHLKRLIVGGMERVFEIGRIFRNEGMSTRHNPEFTMMELYQAFGDWNDVMDITEVLITTAALDATGTTIVSIGGADVDLTEPWPRVRMVDAVSAKVGREVHPSQPIDELRTLAEQHDVRWEARWGGGKIVEELFEKLCEADLVRPDVRHRPSHRDLPARPRRSPRPVADRAFRALRRRAANSATATPNSTTRSNSGCVSRRSRPPRTPATTKRDSSTRTTSGRSSTACRRRVGSASAWTGWRCCSPASTRSRK